MSPVKYTDRRVYTYNHSCTNASQMHFRLNGQPFTTYQVQYFANRLGFIEFNFGLLKPGDQLQVYDDCGSTPYAVTVSDDFVYVEVPNGQSYTGNNIPPGDESSPYGRLSTPVEIGKCEPVTIGAHGLHNYGVFVSTNTKGTPVTIGKFSINGQPLRTQGNTISHIGYENPVNYTVSSAGGVTFDGPVKFTSQAFYSGQTPVTIEYQHNGAVYDGDLDLSIGGLSFRYVKNTGFSVQKATYTSSVTQTDYTGDYSHSIFRITYDGQYFKAYVDNVLVETLARFVVYEANGGSLTQTGVLPYGATTTFTPTQSGSGWVGVLVDGVLYTRQQFKIADDLSINPTVTNVSCAGASTGKISVAATGGKAPLQYQLNTGGYSAGSTFTGLAAGTYTISVRDASGCIQTRTVTISQLPALSATISSQTDASCRDKQDGSVTIAVAGGTAPYQYATNGTTVGSANTLTGLSAGQYQIRVTDASGCVQTLPLTIGTRSQLSASLGTVQHVACQGGATGSIAISTAGSQPVGPLRFSIDGGATSQNTPQFTGLPAGSYTIRVNDDLCSVAVAASLTEPTALQATATISKPITCYNAPTGVVIVSGTGGTSPYTYSADNSSFGSGNQFTGIAAGSYKYWLKDANGCTTATAIVTLTQPAALAATITNRQDATCSGSATGSLTVQAGGGTAPYAYSRNGIDFYPSGQFSGLAATSYTLVVRDAGGCSATTTASIGQPTVLTAVVASQQPITCAGGTDGRITVAATGGTAPYTYALGTTPFASTSTFATLQEGTYTVGIRDANNCQTSVSAALTARSKLLIGVTNTTMVSCYGRSDGAATVSTTGSIPVGTLLYSANGTSYQATPTLTGLAAGSYTLRLKDDLCEVTQPIVLTQPTALSAQAGVQNHVACWQGNDGTVALTAQGGTTPYQYSADGTTYQPAASVTGLPLGTFTYWVKDRNGCVVTTNPVSVTQPTALLLAVAARRDVRCYGGSDGVVSLTASGGTPGYRFSLPSTTFQASEGFTGLAAAGYTARVQDGHGCITSLSLTVGQPQAPFTLALTNRRNLTCWQDNGGQLTVAGSGGTGPYQYALNNGAYAASNTFTGLAAGAYVVNGTDAQGCTATLTGQSLTEPDQVVVSLRNKLDVDCEYYTRGEAQVSAQGGQGSFVFSLTGRDILGNPLNPSPRTDGVFKALAAGNYEVTATDGSGCTGTYTVAIRARNSAIRFSLNAQPPASCQQATGQISVDNVTGGRPPYQYRIATQPSFSTSPQFGGLSAGSYLVTVADSLCAYTKAVSLDVAGSLSAAYTLTPRDCRTPNADIQVTSIQGGSGTYQLSLNGGAATTNRTFTNLLPGLYSIRVEDVPLSCPTVVSIEVVPQNGAGLRLAERQSVSCWQGSNGRLVFATENATGPFRFALDGGNPSSSSTFEGLTAGWHKLVVQNRLGCIDSMRVLITQPPLLQLATVARNNDCFGDQTGAVTASASGGVSPYQYSTDGVTYVSTTTLAGLKAGTYTVRVRDANGCVTPTATTVSQPPLLTLQASYADTIRCFGESNGTVRLTAGGGTATYRYAIDSLTYGTDPLFGGLKTGTYTFWVSDAHSCRTKTQLALTQPAVLKLALLGQANPLCYGDSSGRAQVLATGGNGGYQYYVNEGRPQASGQFSGLTQSRYGFRVIDRRGCTDTTARIQLSWPAPITSTFSTQQPRCYGESTGSITVTLQGGTPPFQTTGPNRPATSPTFAFANLTAGNYTLPFTDQHGCRYTLPVTLGQPTALSATTVMKPNDCFGDQTGQLTVTGQGATPPYRYGLTNPGSTDTTTQTAGVFARLRAGTYALRVRDAHGCLLQQSPAVNQPTKVTLQAIYADTVRCFGETNGRVRLLANGGVGGYRYTLDPTQAGLVDSLFTGLRAGPYQFWVNDQNGCRESASLTVTQPDRLKLTLTDRTDPRCAGDANGVIQVTSAGGNGTNTYWLDNARRQVVGRFDNLAQAEYTLKVVDRRGCEDTIRRVVLTWPKSLQASVRTIVPRCMGDANGAILTKVTGGVGSFSATLTGAALSTTGTDSLRFTNLSAGRYELAINDQHGCRLALPVTVSKPDPLSAVQLGDSSVVCKGQIVKLNAGNPGRSVAWYRDGQPIGTSQQIEAITPGLYRVVVTNATGCQTTAQYKLINSDKALDAEFLMAVQAFVGDTVYALNQSNPFPKTLHWELPAEAYALEKSLKQAAFVITTAGTYTIKLVAISEECQNQKERQIRIFRHEDIDQTDDQLGYKDLHIIDKVTVSPNPNYGKFRIQVDLSKVRDVEVLITRSANSALVYQHSDTGKLQYTFDVSLSNPAQDIYVVLIRAGTATYTQKLLIMH